MPKPSGFRRRSRTISCCSTVSTGRASTWTSYDARWVERASLIPDLNVRIRESPWHLDYPVWEPMPVDASLVRVHELARKLVALVHSRNRETTREPRRPARGPRGRCTLFHGVTGVPRCSGPALIAVLQVAHFSGGRQTRVGGLLASCSRRNRPQSRRRDVRRSGTAEILGRAVLRLPGQLVSLFRDGRAGHRAQLTACRRTPNRELLRRRRRARPKVRSNIPPGPHRLVRMVVRDSADFRGDGVSVNSRSDDSHLGSDGELPSPSETARYPPELGAEVTIAKAGTPTARNHFRNAGVRTVPGS